MFLFETQKLTQPQKNTPSASNELPHLNFAWFLRQVLILLI